MASAVRAAHPGTEIVGCDLRQAPDVDRMVICDLGDRAAVAALMRTEGPGVVFHLAGLLSGSPEEMRRVNVGCTRNLLDAVSASGHNPTVVVAGSAAEYGAVSVGQLPIKESQPLSPLPGYGESKAQQSMLALDYARTGMDVRVGRIFGILGPGMSTTLFVGSVVQQLAQIAANGGRGEIRVGDLGARRDWLDATDIARALLAIADRGSPGAVFNICSGSSIAMHELLARLIAAFGVDVEIVREEGRVRTSDIPDSVGSNLLLRTQTGWEPQVSLEAAIARLAGVSR